MIKDHTTDGDTQPRCIPGKSAEIETSKGFEDQFYGQLLQEHERADLFVRSKAGEIERKLGVFGVRIEPTQAHMYSRPGKTFGESKKTLPSLG